MRPGRKTAAVAALGLSAALVLLGMRENKHLEVNEYKVYGVDIPENFHGFRIVQISDLHNASFGEENGQLLSSLEASHPDISAITGDLVDSRRPDEVAALAFVEEAAKVAPVYYVPGNHEAHRSYSVLAEKLTAVGVTVLENEICVLEKEGQTLTVIGLMDPAFSDEKAFLVDLSRLSEETAGFTVLLSHRPEYFGEYAAAGIGLALCGHAHGGQFRFPLIGGLIAPGQGLFPLYDSGLFTEGKTTMAVSRGLGNSIIPLRLGNPPELVVVELMGPPNE